MVQEAGGLVLEFSPRVTVLAVRRVDRGSPTPVAGREVSRLEAKAGDDPVDLRSEVPEGLAGRPAGRDLPRAQAAEVLGRQRGLVLVELDHHPLSGGLVPDGKFQEAPRTGSGRWRVFRDLWLRCVLGFELAKELLFLALVLFERGVDGVYLRRIVFFVKPDQPDLVVIIFYGFPRG